MNDIRARDSARLGTVPHESRQRQMEDCSIKLRCILRIRRVAKQADRVQGQAQLTQLLRDKPAIVAAQLWMLLVLLLLLLLLPWRQVHV